MDPAALAYTRDALADGQWWRVATASLLHLSLAHFAMNMAALAAVFAAWGRGRSAEGAAVLATLALAQWPAAYWLAPGLAWGAGLSGALHGLVAYWSLGDALDHRATRSWRRFGALGLCGLAMKLAAEAAWPPGDAALPVAAALHRIGAGLGAALALVALAARRASGRRRVDICS